MINLVLFGAPGSGKGTQSKRLTDRYDLYHISTGDVLRDHIARHTDIGRLADKYISKGHLIPDDVMIEILEHVMEEQARGKKGVVFDGFPRTIPQAIALRDMLERKGQKVDAVIGLEVPEDELIRRMLKRGQDTGRTDDNKETIAKRLEVYENQTKPLKHHYDKAGKYIGIKGEGSVDDIFDNIARNLDETLKAEKEWRQNHNKH